MEQCKNVNTSIYLNKIYQKRPLEEKCLQEQQKFVLPGEMLQDIVII